MQKGNRCSRYCLLYSECSTKMGPCNTISSPQLRQKRGGDKKVHEHYYSALPKKLQEKVQSTQGKNKYLTGVCIERLSFSFGQLTIT